MTAQRILGFGVVGWAGMRPEQWLSDCRVPHAPLFSPEVAPEEGGEPASTARESVWPGLVPDNEGTVTPTPPPLGDVRAFAASLFTRIEPQLLWGFRAEPLLGAKGLRTFDRLTRLTLVAVQGALQESGLGDLAARCPDRFGLAWGSAFGALESIEELHRVAELEEPRFINPNRFPNTVANAAAGQVAIWYGVTGPNITAVDGRCSGASALAHAARKLDAGEADCMLVGVSETLSLGMCQALDAQAARAEALRLPGFPSRYGEGSVFMALGRAEDPALSAAAADSAAPTLGFHLATALRFQSPGDGRRLVYPERALARAITTALTEAGLSPQDVDVVLLGGAIVEGAALDAERRAVAEVLGGGARMCVPGSVWGECFAVNAGFNWLAALSLFAGGAWPTPAPAGDGAGRPDGFAASAAAQRSAERGRPDIVLVVSTDTQGLAAATILRSPSAT